MKKQLLKKLEVAESLSISVNIVNELIQHKKLETVEIKPGIVRVKRSSVLSYLKNEYPSGGGSVSLKRLFSFLWVAAIVAFAIHLLISANFGSEKYWQDWRVWLLLGNIGLGIIFFLAAFLTIGKGKGNKFSIARNTAWSLPIIYLLTAVIPALADVDLSQRRVTPVINPPTPTIIVTPTPTQVKAKTQATTKTNTTGSQIDCIGPDGKQFKTSMDECKKLNEQWGKPIDYMTNCTYSAECVGGGGVRYVKKSECDKPCVRATGNSTTATTPQSTFTNSGSVYCWNNAYGYAYYTSSGNQCNADNLKSSTYKLCMDTQNIKNNTCKSVCKSELDKDNYACAWAYTGSNPGIEQSTDKYGECLNGPGGSGELYGTCLKKCTDQYGTDIKSCTM